MSFQIIYTKKGLEKLALAETGTPLVLEKFAVGSGELEPSEAQTALQDEKFRTYISNISQGVINKTNLLLNCVIPSDSGIEESFTINELGLFDTVGDLIAIAKVPSSDYVVNTSGVSSEKVYNITLKVSNTADVTLNLNSSTLATAESVAALQKMVEELQRKNDERIGTIFDSAFYSLPKGSLVCNGARLNQADYPKLFEKIGFTWGEDLGDGTFQLPKSTGRVTRHCYGSEDFGTTQEDAMQNITGQFAFTDDGSFDMYVRAKAASGAFDMQEVTTSFVNSDGVPSSTTGYGLMKFDASKVVRTADETRVKSIITRKAIWYE